jgi:hypothetical protein
MYSFPIHPPNPINQSGCADQHFFGITSTKSAGSAKRAAIYNGNAPSCGSAFEGCRGGG